MKKEFEENGKLVRAKELMARHLGEEAIISDDEKMGEWRDPFAAPGDPEHEPSFVVQPSSTEEIQQVLQIAREVGVPVWTSSMGRNFGYGGSAPVERGTIIMNLRRMNRVLEINVKHGYALIEPGVSFLQLYEALKEAEAPLMMSVPDLGWGSMIGNALQHGIGYNIMGDHASALCGLEVVLANGEIVRTGQGAIADGVMWNCHRRGYGPSIDDLFKQSNFGIVTKAGIWLTPQPDVINAATITCHSSEDIGQIVDLISTSLQEGSLQGLPMIVSNPPELSGGQAPFTYKNLGTVLRPGRWNVRLGLYGNREMVAARRATLEKIVASIPDAKLEIREYAGGSTQSDVDPRDYITAGIPNMVLQERLGNAFGDKMGHIDFSPVLPIDGDLILQVETMVRKTLAKHDLVAAFGLVMMPRSIIAPCMTFFDATDPARVNAAKSAVREMHEQIAKMGFGLYRTHISLVDLVSQNYGYGDGELGKLYSKIKHALDPEGILSPCSHGIRG